MKIQRVLLSVAIGLLASGYILPLWKITLEAPQYPEPIGLYIFISDLRGIGEHDLENINILNHYIGMKPIYPDSFSELRWMPWILGALIAVGAVVLIKPKRLLMWSWAILIAIAAAVGLYDFNQWEIEYGTNLNPNAPIKIEGQTYKPPLIGTKQLLNITAHSYPSWGGYAIVLSLVLILVAILRIHQRGNAPEYVQLGQSLAMFWCGMLIVSSVLESCSPVAEPIRYDIDECAVCRMTISDRRFGAEVVTTKGKVYKFDSIECMLEFLRSGVVQQSEISLLLTMDYLQPGTLIDATSAYYLHSEELASPMGAGLSSYSTHKDAQSAQARYKGTILSWDGLKHRRL